MALHVHRVQQWAPVLHFASWAPFGKLSSFVGGGMPFFFIHWPTVGAPKQATLPSIAFAGVDCSCAHGQFLLPIEAVMATPFAFRLAAIDQVMETTRAHVFFAKTWQAPNLSALAAMLGLLHATAMPAFVAPVL